MRSFWDALEPWHEGVYVNFLGDEGAERVRQSYGPEKIRPAPSLEAEVRPGQLLPDQPEHLAELSALAHHDGVRRDLPSGTVTFLFTDVEGSTKLLHELGAEALRRRARRAPPRHARGVRRHGGVEVDTQGDAFFVAFPTAPGALAAADGAARGARAGPDPGADGPAHRHAAAWPTRATSASTSTAPPASPPPATAGRCSSRRRPLPLVGATELRDLGEHRFKDLSGARARSTSSASDELPAARRASTGPTCRFRRRRSSAASTSWPRSLALLSRSGRPPAHPDRPGRDRQDAARAAQAAEPRRRTTRTASGGCRSRRFETRSSCSETAAQALGANDGLAEHIGDKRCSSSSTTSSRSSRRPTTSRRCSPPAPSSSCW